MEPAAGAALIRIAAYPNDVVVPAWPDLVSGEPSQWRTWLGAAWGLPGFAAAVTAATPELAERIARALSDEAVPRQRLRRLVEAVVRYLLRWTTRATPFGTFAGVAPIQFGAHAAVRVGEAHRAVARPDGGFIAEHVTRAEQDLARLRTVALVTNSLGYQRGGKWVLPCARAEGDRRWDVEIRLTGPVEAAIQAARSPVGFTELTAKIAGPADEDKAERLLAELVQVGVLLSALRPAMTDPLAYGAHQYAELDRSDRVAVDLRADVEVTLPPAVLREAGRAAATLVAVAPPLPGWAEYHSAFIERWGPGAAVPVRNVLNVLGFPAGYRGSARRVPPVFTARDRLLGHLAQQSALDGCAEVVLDDALIERLRDADGRPPIPHTELRFTLAADTLKDLDRGAFTLTILSGSRHAGVSAARFLHLLTPAEFASFQHVYQQLPTSQPDAATVQLSGPPLDARLVAVARTPALLPILPLGDFHSAPPWTVDDLAVAGDGQRLWLVSRTTGQPVEPLLCNSVLLPALQQPLMRFLTEIWTAWNAPCSRFDWGQASGLPFLPRLRRGRTIVHPGRWIIDRTALAARSTGWLQWRQVWQQHRQQRQIPQQVLIGDDDVRLRLDLDNHAHLAVLRDHLDRHARTVVTEAPGPAGWIANRPAELLLTLTHTVPVTRPARPAQPVPSIQHWPGHSRWLEARLYGELDAILTDLADRSTDHLPPGWWFVRYPDPEPHLRLRIQLSDTDQFACTAVHLADWVAKLDDDAVLHDYSLHPYRPEIRHGTGSTLAAAEAVFSADSRAALRRLTGDRQAATAASMIAIADGFTGDGLTWLATHVPQRSGLRLDPAQLRSARIPFHDKQLAAALAAYRSQLGDDRLDPDQTLGDLLHLHHARMIGVDAMSEQHCLRLARTIARTAHAGRAS
jgi:lantibiotic biosynthesis protein